MYPKQSTSEKLLTLERLLQIIMVEMVWTLLMSGPDSTSLTNNSELLREYF